MENFKVTLDRIEENIAVLLVRDEEKIKINIPFILLSSGSKEGDILDIAITLGMCKGQRLQKKEFQHCLRSLKTRSEANESHALEIATLELEMRSRNKQSPPKLV